VLTLPPLSITARAYASRYWLCQSCSGAAVLLDLLAEARLEEPDRSLVFAQVLEVLRFVWLRIGPNSRAHWARQPAVAVLALTAVEEEPGVSSSSDEDCDFYQLDEDQR
jgi:hypothetical protein